MHWRAAAIAMVMWACGGRTPSPGPAGGGHDEPTSAACPATFAAAETAGACRQVGATCAFPEGTCTCAPSSYCGGVEPTEEVLAQLRQPVWQCRRPRTDGCPEEVPAGACPQPGQQCSYGDCCISTSTCTDGQWVNGEASCPP